MGMGVCSNRASSGEPPASQNHFNHWVKLNLNLKAGLNLKISTH